MLVLFIMKAKPESNIKGYRKKNSEKLKTKITKIRAPF